MCKHDEGKLGNQRGGGLLSNAWQEDAGDTFYDNHCCHLSSIKRGGARA